MGEAFIVRRGGGGAGLNFKVVGSTTQPGSPSENMIWVNTSTAITSWIFSATQPTSPSAGMVWILTGESSTVSFNALKKNGIQVYPISAKQYIGGAWVDKTAKSYQSGAWVDWIAWLYNLGDKCEQTGNWIAVAKKGEASDGNATMPTVTYNADNVVVKCGTSGYPSGMFYKDVKLNLSGAKTLTFDGFCTTDKFWLTVWSDIGTYCKDNLVASVQITNRTRGTTQLSVESLTGEYYVGFWCIGSLAVPKMTMYKLYAG